MFRYVVLGLRHSGTALHGHALMKAFLDDLRSSYEEWLATLAPKPAAPDVPALPLASGANKRV